MPDDAVEQLRAAIAALEAVVENRDLLSLLPEEERTRLLTAAGDVYAPNLDERRRQLKVQRREEKAARARRHQDTLDETGIRLLRAKPVFMTPNVFPPTPTAVEAEPIDASERLHCYICKRDYTEVHAFYDQMCPECAVFNLAKRTETADLAGRVALLTGGRVKIGYQAGIKLLRAGAHLVVTTRFPRDSAVRYAAEEDFEDWGHRLEIYGLDLRHTPSVEQFCRHMNATHDRLDFIVNNACQTVRRPPEFYRHMLDRELAASDAMAPRALALTRDASSSAEMSQLALLPEDVVVQPQLFPVGQLDQDLQQIDLRDRNSWRLTMAEVSSVELLETQLVNAVAPFVLNARLKPLMLRTANRDKHIVNVSAVEGQFYRRFKTTRHPHRSEERRVGKECA